MTAFQHRWIELATRFGLKVRTPFRVDLGDVTIEVPVLLEEIGASRGMVLVTAYGDLETFTDRLVSAGFGYSCLSEPTERDIDEHEVIEMLRDWGWSGSGDAPAWYAA